MTTVKTPELQGPQELDYSGAKLPVGETRERQEYDDADDEQLASEGQVPVNSEAGRDGGTLPQADLPTGEYPASSLHQISDADFLRRLAEAFQPISNDRHDGEKSERLRRIARELTDHYPTPEAYELACIALEKHRKRADEAEAELAARGPSKGV